MNIEPGLQFFGSLVDLDCHIQDLKLVLKKTEEISFSEHRESESLISDIYPDTTRKTFIVSLLISLNAQMSGYCTHLKKYDGQKIKWNDLKGSALERFIKYSEKVCGLSPVADEATKQKMRGLIELRNCIVHSDSEIEGFGKAAALRSFTSHIKGISLASGRIELTLEACMECADLIHSFMESDLYQYFWTPS